MQSAAGVDPVSPVPVAPPGALSHAQGRLAVVNGLRGVAILAVIYHHLLSLYLTPFGTGMQRVGKYLFSWCTPLTNGWMGVCLFFVLSGFVLALPYELGERSMESFRDAGSFLVRRGRRLFPLYYVSLILLLLLETRSRTFQPGPPAFVVRLFTFTFIYHEPQFLPYSNIALWSLAVEVVFSLFFPLLIALFRRVGATPVTVAAFAIALAVRYYGTAQHHGYPSQLSYIKDGPFGRLDDFVLGMAICRLYVKQRLPRPAVAACGIFLGAGLVYASAVLWDNVFVGVLPYTAASFLHDMTNLGFALILVGFLAAPALLKRLITVAPLQLFGMMCYSLYVWHVFGMTLKAPSWKLVQVPSVLVVTFLFSAATYRYIEFPRASFRKLFLEFPR